MRAAEKIIPRLGNLPLDRPYIVATLVDDPVNRLDIATELGADVLEVRMDLIDRPIDDFPRMFHILRDLTDLPVIATNRREGEGGGWRGPERERIDVLTSVFDYVDAVDIEYYAQKRDDVMHMADEYNILKVVSFHDMNDTPPLEFIRSMVEDMFDVGADVSRMVTTANDRRDVLRILEATMDVSGMGLVSTMCLGKEGDISRVLAPLFGSILTYGSVDPVENGINVAGISLILDILT